MLVNANPLLLLPRRFTRTLVAGLFCLLVSLVSASPAGAADTSTMLSAKDNEQTLSMCGKPNEVAFARGRELLMTEELARNQQLYSYSVSAAYAANCINRMVDYVRTMSDAIDKVMQVSKAVLTAQGDPGSIAAAALTLVATEIMNAVMRQVMNAITNQICNITNELVYAMDSVVKNAICLPQINIPGLNTLGFDVDIKLQMTTCDGWSINPLGVVGQTVQVPDSVNGSALTSRVVQGLPVEGMGGLNYNAIFPPQYRSDSGGGGSDDDLWMDYVAGTDDIEDKTAYGTTPDFSCKSGSTGSKEDFKNALSKYESGGCSNQYTCQTPSGKYRGKYQMGVQLLATLGYVKCSTSQCKGDNWNTISWTGKNGISSLNAYYSGTINGRPAQETIMDDEINTVLSQASYYGLDKYIGQSICGVTITKSGLAASIHLLGIGSMINNLKNQNCGAADGNGTTWMKYAGTLSCFTW